MVESVAATSSIQDINTAIIAQMNAAKAAKAQPSSSVGDASFVSELQALDKRELAPPTQLAGLRAASGGLVNAPPEVQEAAVGEPDKEPACDTPKISRSDRMACAEQATHVSYEDDNFSFFDLVDLVNPLQHIPVVGTMYRELTGDTIKPEIQVAGSIGYGLTTGSLLVSLVTGIASAIMEQSSGKEPLVQVADALFEDKVDTGSPLTEDKIVLAETQEEATPMTMNPIQLVQASKVLQPIDNEQIAAQNAAPDVAAIVAPTSVASVQQTKPKMATSALMSPTGGLRVGHVIHMNPSLRTSAPTAVAAKTATDVPPGSKADLDKATLGALIHAQAKAHEAGQALPSELVQDMMTMALDKYKAAHMASAQGAGTTSVQ